MRRGLCSTALIPPDKSPICHGRLIHASGRVRVRVRACGSERAGLSFQEKHTNDTSFTQPRCSLPSIRAERARTWTEPSVHRCELLDFPVIIQSPGLGWSWCSGRSDDQTDTLYWGRTGNYSTKPLCNVSLKRTLYILSL